MVMAINLVAGKWAVPILWHLLLAGKPLRFTEIRRLVPPVTQKELTKQLRLFEEQGLAMRKVHPAAAEAVLSQGSGDRFPSSRRRADR